MLWVRAVLSWGLRLPGAAPTCFSWSAGTGSEGWGAASRGTPTLVNLWAGRRRRNVANVFGGNDRGICSRLLGKCSGFRDRQARLLLFNQSLSFLSLSLPLCDGGEGSRGIIHGGPGAEGVVVKSQCGDLCHTGVHVVTTSTHYCARQQHGQVALAMGDGGSGETGELQTRRGNRRLAAGGDAQGACAGEAGPGRGPEKHSISAAGRARGQERQGERSW